MKLKKGIRAQEPRRVIFLLFSALYMSTLVINEFMKLHNVMIITLSTWRRITTLLINLMKPLILI